MLADMDLIDYLNKHFLTREQLLARAGIDGARLNEWQERGMMPRPSYRLRLDLACESVFGPHEEQHAIDWYAQGYVAWAGLLDALDGPRQALIVFSDRYRRRLAQLAAEDLIAADADLTAEAHLAAEWRHFLDGTYGLCTRTGLPEEIAAKEAAIGLIKELTASGGERALTDEQRRRLAAAVDLLDRASAPFAPHERERSSRHRYVDEVRARF
jgi:hypothetical protein